MTVKACEQVFLEEHADTEPNLLVHFEALEDSAAGTRAAS